MTTERRVRGDEADGRATAYSGSTGMSSARAAASMPLGVGLPDQGLELGPGKKLEESAEQAAAWAHG